MENLRKVINGIEHVEEWRDIKGFEGLYKASSFGRVKSLDRIIQRRFNNDHTRSFDKSVKGRIIKQETMKLGYVRVGLSNGGKITRFL